MPPRKRRKAGLDDARQTHPLEQTIKDAFYLQVPEDLFEIYALAKALKPDDPLHAFAEIDLKLGGPFRILDGKSKTAPFWCLQDRFKFDPPEVVTVAVSIKSPSLHLGLHRDAPSEPPKMVVRNDSKLGGTFEPASESRGLALAFVSHAKKHMAAGSESVIQRLVAMGSSPPAVYMETRAWNKRGIDDTLSGTGIVVPYNKTTEVGWRPLECTDKALKKYLVSLIKAKNTGATPDFSMLDRIISFANIANDECDYGQALKLGLDLYSHADVFDNDALALLAPTYRLLQRDAFATVIERATADKRRRDAAV